MIVSSRSVEFIFLQFALLCMYHTLKICLVTDAAIRQKPSVAFQHTSHVAEKSGTIFIWY